MKLVHTLRLDWLRWRHWLLIALLVLVTLVKAVPQLGTVYTSHVYPLIGGLLSHVSGLFPLAVGDVFIALSIAWCIVYPIYKRKKAAHILAVKFGTKVL